MSLFNKSDNKHAVRGEPHSTVDIILASCPAALGSILSVLKIFFRISWCCWGLLTAVHCLECGQCKKSTIVDRTHLVVASGKLVLVNVVRNSTILIREFSVSLVLIETWFVRRRFQWRRGRSGDRGGTSNGRWVFTQKDEKVQCWFFSRWKEKLQLIFLYTHSVSLSLTFFHFPTHILFRLLPSFLLWTDARTLTGRLPTITLSPEHKHPHSLIHSFFTKFSPCLHLALSLTLSRSLTLSLSVSLWSTHLHFNCNWLTVFSIYPPFFPSFVMWEAWQMMEAAK